MSRLALPLAALLAMANLATVKAEPRDSGLASFYSEVPEKSEKFSAAHRNLPFGTMVSVMRPDTGAHVVVRINDRGPFIAGRIIDLSRPAAEHLGMVDLGVARVSIEVIPAPVPAIRKPQRYE